MRALAQQTGGAGAGGGCRGGEALTTVISLPAARRNALVHRSLRGLYLFLKVLWHFDLQNLKTCGADAKAASAQGAASRLGSLRG